MKKQRYIVALPKEGVNVRGYPDIPKIGGIFATSPQSAVSQYLHRNFDTLPANKMMSYLNTKFHGAVKYAFKIPQVRGLIRKKGKFVLDSKPLTYHEKEKFTEMAVAQGIADIYNSKDPGEYLARAREVLEDFKKQF